MNTVLRKALKVLWYVLLSVAAVMEATALVVWLLQWRGLETALIMVVAASALAWGWVIRWLYKDGRITVSHILVIWMVWTGTVMGGASYYLAYRGIADDLETLSRYIMVEVVAGVGGYFVKSGVENVAAKITAKKSSGNDSI
ncbi:MAG: hypothetical protein LIO54_03785 [Oscillospiraceae bacterium]|nr:hypothetical protein [Oscillospiraceae bacterium]